MLYAIGDIHGCLSSLQDLLGKIEPTDQDTLVFLGDYIDRGPNSREVVDFLLERRRPLGDSCAATTSRCSWIVGRSLGAALESLAFERRPPDPAVLRALVGPRGPAREGERRAPRAAFPESHRVFFRATELFVDTRRLFSATLGWTWEAAGGAIPGGPDVGAQGVLGRPAALSQAGRERTHPPFPRGRDGGPDQPGHGVRLWGPVDGPPIAGSAFDPNPSLREGPETPPATGFFKIY
jgi:hypothetical protein